MDDLISRQAAIEAIGKTSDELYENIKKGATFPQRQWFDGMAQAQSILENLPSAQAEITLESAIDYLHSIGWMQEHDRILTESAQPEQRWIPCSERLPEDYQDVLVWFEYYRYGSYNRMYSTHGIGTYSKRYDSWMINHESGWKDLHVIAWMPLPEPYKEGIDDYKNMR